MASGVPAPCWPRCALALAAPCAARRRLASRAQTPDVRGGPAGARVVVAARAEPRPCRGRLDPGQGCTWRPGRRVAGTATPCQLQVRRPDPAPRGSHGRSSHGWSRDVRSAGSRVAAHTGVRGGEVSPGSTPWSLPLLACPAAAGVRSTTRTRSQMCREARASPAEWRPPCGVVRPSWCLCSPGREP